ncbi:hypothetical protein ABB37_05967 [Leptomonas pyrrhocoris]|uniref:Uncharacterized protein n=1 Tax=Leptomonas pyrrhocoris TaxID=157538 RepID=A0A0M9FZ22_LEPPY|nr:hypothetical protein ABB37_05967 [Leptomonas pyrrhocoris]KPA78903.1 hypothetical protein ABB37_05967 [Leptomonas pyrrhocoris]|eukprot:XP_015657342.1 hypothetical protein ABB37_05967 [Leptomonas pyrrhocoris]
MRSETNNAWAEGSGEDPQRPSEGDVGRYTDNSQSTSQAQTCSDSREASGARATVSLPSSVVLRSSRGQRETEPRPPVASPPPRLPAKYAAQMATAVADTPADTSAGYHDRGTHSSASGAMYSNDDEEVLEYVEDESEGEEGEEGEWEEVGDEEEEEQEESESAEGARALRFDSEESRAMSSQPTAFINTASTSAAAVFATPHAAAAAAIAKHANEAQVTSGPSNAFRRATPKARAGYSVGYTPADAQSSSETPQASPSRHQGGTAEAHKTAGECTTAPSVTSVLDARPFRTAAAADTDAAASSRHADSPVATATATAASTAPPALFAYQGNVAFPLSTYIPPSAPNTMAAPNDVPLKASATSFPSESFPVDHTPSAATGEYSVSATPGDDAANLCVSLTPAEAATPLHRDVDTPGSCPPGVSPPHAAAETAATTTVFGQPSRHIQTPAEPDVPTTSTGVAGAEKAEDTPAKPASPVQPAKPFRSSTPTMLQPAVGAAAAAAVPTSGAGLLHSTTASEPVPNFFAGSSHAGTFTRTEKKPNIFPRTSVEPAARPAAPFAGLVLSSATTSRCTVTAAVPAAPTAVEAAGIVHTSVPPPSPTQERTPRRKETAKATEGAAATTPPQQPPPSESSSAAPSRLFTSLARSPASVAVKSQQDWKAPTTVSVVRHDVSSTTSSPVSPQRPTAGLVDVRPASSSRRSSSVDYSTMVGSPRFAKEEEEDGEEEVEGGKGDAVEVDVDNVAAAATAAATTSAEAVKASLLRSSTPINVVTVLPSAAASADNRSAEAKHARRAAVGRSKTVEDILAVMEEAGAAEDILRSACEREEDHVRTISAASSSFTPPVDLGSGRSVGLHRCDALPDEGSAAAAAKPATVFYVAHVKPPTPPPIALKVTVTHFYNYSEGEGRWLAAPHKTRHAMNVSSETPMVHTLPSSSSSAAAADADAAASLEVALYCRPLLVHLPRPPLPTLLLLYAEGRSGPLRRAAHAARYVFGVLLPTIVRTALQLLIAITLLVICTLVFDELWREYPAVRVWAAQVGGYVQRIPLPDF